METLVNFTLRRMGIFTGYIKCILMMAKQIGSESRHKTLAEDIRNLPPFEGLFKNDHYNKSFAKIKIENYFERFGNWGDD